MQRQKCEKEARKTKQTINNKLNLKQTKMKKQMYVAPKAEVIELNVNKDFMQKVPGNDGGNVIGLSVPEGEGPDL